MKIALTTDPVTFDIVTDTDTAAVAAIDQDNKTISATGDISGFLEKGSRININGSTDNDRTFIHVGYTVVSAIYDGSTNTDIIVEEDIPDATADGNVEYYDGIDTANKKFIIAGDQTLKFAADDIIEIVNAENALLNGAYKVVSDTFTGGRTEIVVVETIPSVLGTVSGKMLIFEGSTTGMFMIKGLGIGYNLEPQGSVNVAKRKALVLSGRQNDQRQDQNTPHEDSIVVAVPNGAAEYVFKFSALRLPETANIDAAIAAIQAIVNP